MNNVSTPAGFYYFAKCFFSVKGASAKKCDYILWRTLVTGNFMCQMNDLASIIFIDYYIHTKIIILLDVFTLRKGWMVTDGYIIQYTKYAKAIYSTAASN